MIPTTRGEHVHVRLRGTKKDKPIGYRMVGYEVDENGIIGDILVMDRNGDTVKLADLEVNERKGGKKRVEIVTYDWIGCCEPTWR